MNIKITGLGSYIPNEITPNSKFLDHNFLNSDGSIFKHSNEVIIKKFQAITGIEERRYAPENINTSDMAYLAAKKAVENANLNVSSMMIIDDANVSSSKDRKADDVMSHIDHMLEQLHPEFSS